MGKKSRDVSGWRSREALHDGVSIEQTLEARREEAMCLFGGGMAETEGTASAKVLR